MVHHYSRAAIIVALLVLCLGATLPAFADNAKEILMPASGKDPLGTEKVGGSGAWCKLGQRLTIHGEVLAIGYRVWKQGNPTGDIIFSIYDAETDSLIVQKRWGDASELPELVSYGDYQYVTLDKPIRINGDVRLCVEFHKGTATDHCWGGYYSGDHITGQYYTNFFCYGVWSDIGEAEEGSYYLRYIPDISPGKPPPKSASGENGVNPHLIIAPIVVAVGSLLYVLKRKRA